MERAGFAPLSSCLSAFAFRIVGVAPQDGARADTGITGCRFHGAMRRCEVLLHCTMAAEMHEFPVISVGASWLRDRSGRSLSPTVPRSRSAFFAPPPSSASRPSPSSPRKTSSPSTASRPTRPTRSARAWADRGLSVDPRDHPRRARGRRPTPSIPAMASSPRIPILPRLRRRRSRLHRAEPDDHAPPRRQGLRAKPRRVGRRPGHAGERTAAR